MPNSKNSEIPFSADNLTQDSSPETTDQQKKSNINNALSEQRSDINEVLTSESSSEWNSLNPFRQWLQLFWVEKGNYKITEKGYRELSGLEQRQFQEMTESISTRTKDTVKEYRTGLSKKEVEAKVRLWISECQANKLLEDQLIQPKRANWKDYDTRIVVLKKFLTEVDNIKTIKGDDFSSNDLRGLIANYYQDSPHKVLVEAEYVYSEEEIKTFSRTKKFLSEKIYPWELGVAPMSLWSNIEMRKIAVDWLLHKTGKSSKNLQKYDFDANDLGGLIGSSQYQHSPYKALVEAGYAYTEEDIKNFSAAKKFPSEKTYPWELAMAPLTLWSSIEMRKAAVEWLLSKMRRLPKYLQYDDFITNGLGGLIGSSQYQHSPYMALVEAGYTYSEEEIQTFLTTKKFPSEKVYPWELGVAPNGLWDKVAMRKMALEWLLHKTGKSSKDLQTSDFDTNGLGGLIGQYQDSLYKALVEAGYAYSENDIKTFSTTKKFPSEKVYPWELYSAYKNIWNNIEMRRVALEWLLHKTGKSSKDLQTSDFDTNGLVGLIGSSPYQYSPYKALVEAGYAYSEADIKIFSTTKKFPSEKVYPWELANVPNNFWNSVEMRKAAVSWLVNKIDISPEDIQNNDFYDNGLGGLTLHYYQNSPYKAFLEAGYAWSFEEIITQAGSKTFSLGKLYPWQMTHTPNYHDQINDDILRQWHAWYKQQNKP